MKTLQIDAGASVLEALRSRRSMSRLKSDRPPRELVEQVIAAAAWAPNHHKTEPWRFVVLAGRAREDLGAVMADDLRPTLHDPDDEQCRSLLEKERNKPMRAPVLVAAAAMPPVHPKAVAIEEVEATAAGVQNMLLAAQALGLGAMWRTGRAAYSEAVKRFLGLPAGAHLVAFVYLGYPDLPDLPERRRDSERFTTWKGWDEDETEP